jgi:arsenite-transporting ATPase
MPPTALSVKFFSLPSLSLIWIEHLFALRREIIEKRELITKVKFLNKEFERDKVLNKIEAQREQYQKLKEIFENKTSTHVFLVLNPDKLSHAESIRIYNMMKQININLFRTIYNKTSIDMSCDDKAPLFPDIPMLSFPCSETQLIGTAVLERFLNANRGAIEEQLTGC